MLRSVCQTLALFINITQLSLIIIIIISPLVQRGGHSTTSFISSSASSRTVWHIRALLGLPCAPRFDAHPVRRLARPSPHLAYLHGFSAVAGVEVRDTWAIPPLLCIATRSSNTARMQPGLCRSSSVNAKSLVGFGADSSTWHRHNPEGFGTIQPTRTPKPRQSVNSKHYDRACCRLGLLQCPVAFIRPDGDNISKISISSLQGENNWVRRPISHRVLKQKAATPPKDERIPQIRNHVFHTLHLALRCLEQ